MKKTNISNEKVVSILSNFPKKRILLPERYQKIYEKHYLENRNAKTVASKVTAFSLEICISQYKWARI